MKKIHLFTLLTIFTFFSTYSQSSIGFLDNYSGVNSVEFNPANIVDSYYKTDINILSGSGRAFNDYYKLKTYSGLKDFNLGIKDLKFALNNFKIADDLYGENKFLDSLAKVSGLKKHTEYIHSTSPSKNSTFYGDGRIMGPSFMLTLNKENAIAFTTSIRSNDYVYNINTQLYEDFYNNNLFSDPLDILKYEHSKLTGFGQSFTWAEVGFSYGRVIRHTTTDLLKVGASLKFLRGLLTASFILNDIQSSTDFNIINPNKTTINVNGSVTMQYAQDAPNYGQGLDLGFVYEKRDNTLTYYVRDRKGNLFYNKAPYRYKLSASITDIGFLNFDNVFVQTNNINVKFPKNNFNILSYFGNSGNNRKVKKRYLLPTTGHVNFDYFLKPKWYVNANLDMYLLPTNKVNAMKSVTMLSISPRYETPYFSAFLPMNVNRFGVYNLGLGFRTGYFFLGSTSILNNLSDRSNYVDVTFGFKIPLLNKKIIKEYRKSFDYYRR